jgi:hypothetical protein
MFNLLKVDIEFKLLIVVVDVAFKLSMFNLLNFDIEIKLLNVVVDVKLSILEFIVNTDKPDVFTSPTTFNVDKHDSALFNVVVSDTFNEEFELEYPLTFNDELIKALLNLVVGLKMFVPLEFKWIVMSSSRHRHVIVTSSRRRHVIDTPSSLRPMIVVTSLSRLRHVVITSSTSSTSRRPCAPGPRVRIDHARCLPVGQTCGSPTSAMLTTAPQAATAQSATLG